MQLMVVARVHAVNTQTHKHMTDNFWQVRLLA